MLHQGLVFGGEIKNYAPTLLCFPGSARFESADHNVMKAFFGLRDQREDLALFFVLQFPNFVGIFNGLLEKMPVIIKLC